MKRIFGRSESAGLLILAALSLLVFYAGDLYAHARWFIPQQEAEMIPSAQKVVSQIFESGAFSAIVVLAILSLIAVSSLLEQVLFKYVKPIYYLAFVHKDKLAYFLKITVAISLLYSSWQMNFLVPMMPLPEQGLWLFIGLQTGIALLFLINVYTTLAASLLLLSYALLFAINYWITLEHLEIVGIALFILINDSSNAKFKLLKHNAVHILRVCTGFALVFLGLGEKILQPELGAAFLAANDINFIKLYFFPQFEDQYFVMCAGLAEVCFGLTFIFGYSIRLLTLVLFGLMTVTNIYMLEAQSISLAIMELAGHLPFFGIIALMLAFGDGKNITIRKTSYLRYPVARA
jgi:uncharacterized membrane protein YphA (DoxX/SURF4 family)